MVLDSLVTEAVKRVLNEYGQKIPAVELDPFVMTACRFTNEELDLFRYTALVSNRDGEILNSERVLISLPKVADQIRMNNPKKFIHIVADDPVFPQAVVFDHVSAETGANGTYIYKPGEWLDEVFSLSNSIARNWYSLERPDEIQSHDVSFTEPESDYEDEPE